MCLLLDGDNMADARCFPALEKLVWGRAATLKRH